MAAALLADPAWPVRWAAVDAVAWLAQGGSHRVVLRAAAALAERLEDRDWPVRRAAAIGLGNLLGFLEASEADEDVARLALPTFDAVEEVAEAAIRRTLRLLCDAVEEVRLAATDLLPLLCRERGNCEVVSVLVARIEGDERLPSVICRAIVALGRLAVPDDALVLAALEARLVDRNAAVEGAARQAL
ncbi:unnamed protein product, partial [Polarella glacialis]